MKKLMFVVCLMVSGVSFAKDVHVGGYYKKNGTYVAPHERSAPNSYNWDNKSYKPSEPAYNDSYNKNRNADSNYYKPSTTRYQDSNPNNDYPTNTDRKTNSHKKYKSW